MRSFRYPCTGHVRSEEFPAFLERELGAPRANLHSLARELEQEFGAENVVLVNSGSSANLGAALALAEVVGPGAHAIIAGFTFPTTVSALLVAGFEVSVADTEPGGFCIDPAAVRAALRPNTRVVCVTHFLGFPANLPALEPLQQEHGLLLLQDACESMDLRTGGEPAHRRGTLSTWSFYHPHHLPAYGGGAIVFPDRDWRTRIESLVHWGRACTCHYDAEGCPAPPGMSHFFTYVRYGFNLEMSELNACFGRFQLRQWAMIERRRRLHYGILYGALVDSPVAQVYPPPGGSGSPAVFAITLRRANVLEVGERLAQRGVEARSLMGGVISGQPAFRDLPHDGLPNCRAMSEHSFFVGIHQTLAEEDVRAVARILAEELSR